MYKPPFPELLALQSFGKCLSFSSLSTTLRSHAKYSVHVAITCIYVATVCRDLYIVARRDIQHNQRTEC
ncbi:hypothetical protein BT67DRAFT_11618 [Trichocladium antarcticum]|uniref:Uncharacterized protein n=1 Tax=Trichocladium antarcticum TaxID=1450529 RepID=A0AAN6ZHD9_9PEZI|nr:hypothetical protein BT67DRAFT_11618 [Trichocladium antarcticum]